MEPPSTFGNTQGSCHPVTNHVICDGRPTSSSALELVKLADAPREGFVTPQRGGHRRQCGNPRGSDARSRVLVWVLFGLKLTAFGLL